MNRFKVTMGRYNGETRVKEVVFFDADSFEFLDSQTGPVIVFKDDYNTNVGAVDGFDYVELVDPQLEEGKLKDYWAKSEATDTMAA